MEPEVREVRTSEGVARVLVHRPGRGVPRATLLVGHGAGGGVEARDLTALAGRLPADGVEVLLVEQPWRVAGRRVAPAPATLDRAWADVVGDLRRAGYGARRLVTGGRSAGARVACRTAEAVGADAVLALAFPLHPPGRPERSRGDELAAAARVLPVLVVQGSRDPFGTPGEVAEAAAAAGVTVPVTAVPWADHGFAVAAKAPVTGAEALDVLVAAARGLTLGNR